MESAIRSDFYFVYFKKMQIKIKRIRNIFKQKLFTQFSVLNSLLDEYNLICSQKLLYYSNKTKQAKVRICPQCWGGIPVFWSRSLCIPCTRFQEQSQKEVKKLTQSAIKVAHIWAAKASELVKSKTEAKAQTKSRNNNQNPRTKRSRKKLTKSVGKSPK